MSRNKLMKLSYYLFFAIMVFAKGVGLDSGDKIYYVLSAIACVCVIVKLVLTKYNEKQAAAMILLCLIAFVAYRNSGRMGIVLSVLAIVGMKDMELSKLFHLGAIIYGISFCSTVLLSATGLIHNPLVVHEKGNIGEIIRWGMGYSTANVFHISYFILCVFLVYTWKRKYSLTRLLLLMLGNILVFVFSLSYTGVAVTTFYLFLSFYAIRKERLNIVEKIICQFPLPLCLLFSFAGPFLLKYPVMQKVDQMVQARLSFSQYFLQNQPITLFGTRMKDIPSFWVIMDNGYVYIFMTFGIIVFALFCIGYALLIAKYSGINKEKERLPELAIIFSFLLYGIMEQFISNAFMNLSLLFMGELIFSNVEKLNSIISNADVRFEPIKSEVIKRKTTVLIVGGVVSVVALVGTMFFLPKLEYKQVPLSSINYIDATSVIIQPLTAYETKDELKDHMNRYQELLLSEDNIENALITSGIVDKLSAQQVRESLEFSLPQSVQSSGIYDEFRIRLLNLYYNIEVKEYDSLLQQLVVGAQEQAADENILVGYIYSERIGKSFGEDRIEHINNNYNYLVQKDGTIVVIEFYRTILLSVVIGFGLGYVVSVMVVIIRFRIYYGRDYR